MPDENDQADQLMDQDHKVAEAIYNEAKDKYTQARTTFVAASIVLIEAPDSDLHEYRRAISKYKDDYIAARAEFDTAADDFITIQNDYKKYLRARIEKIQNNINKIEGKSQP